MFLLILLVCAGCAFAALMRVGISFIPYGPGGFPFKMLGMILFTSVLIGVAAAFTKNTSFGNYAKHFIEIGLGGGFALFSVFSLETLSFVRSRHLGTGIAFALVSAILCLAGTFGVEAAICYFI